MRAWTLIAIVLLWACGDGTGPGEEITVRGTVLDLGLQPQAGAKVLVAGMTPVTTDADGHFSISGVKTPYQIAATLTSTSVAAIYDGLMADSLELLVPAGSLFRSLPHQATVSGALSGGAYPEQTDYRSSVLFESPETAWTGYLDRGTGDYQIQPKWAGPSTTTGTIHALQWRFDAATGLPAAYAGYGTRAGVALTDGGAAGGQDLQLGPVTTGLLSGTVTLPSGYTISGKTLSAVFATSPAASWRLFFDVSGATSVAYLAPSLAGATFSLEVDALAGDAAAVLVKTGLSANTTGASLIVPAAPVLGGPEDDATGVGAGTRVSWSRMSGAIYLLEITASTAQAVQYYLFTGDTTATIPDLAALGVRLTPGTAYEWVVAGVAPFADPADLALALASNNPPPGDWSTARSAPRHFTTAP